MCYWSQSVVKMVVEISVKIIDLDAVEEGRTGACVLFADMNDFSRAIYKTVFL